MTEAVFPLLGTVFVVLVVLPAFALFTKIVLVVVERLEAEGQHEHNLRYLLLVGSSLVPIGWFLSAALHQVESGKSALACLLDHDASGLCIEPSIFAALLGGLVAMMVVRLVLGHQRVPRSSSNEAQLLATRLEHLLSTRPAMADLRGRLVVTEARDFALGTRGFFRPEVYVGMAFAGRLSDEMLASALGHEREHIRGWDPLRYLVLQVALAVNPLGRGLLESHATRWQASREAHCDREAVVDGAAPLSLADAIVRAARPSSREAVALGARDTAVLEFRVRLLLAFAGKAPARCSHRHSSAVALALAVLLIVLLLPHHTGTAALDALHLGTEQTLAYFQR